LGVGVQRFLKVVQTRKIDRIAAVYVIGSWFVVQAGSIALPAFGAPAWTLRVLIAGAVIGFPITLAAAWVARAHAHPARHGSASAVARHTDMALLVALMLVTAAIAAELLIRWQRAPQARSALLPVSAVQSSGQRSPSTSIAVLPFTSMSDKPSDRYFSDGISTELISELSHTPGLRVAARTSSFSFRGKSADIKTIAKTLDVHFILDGAVRVEGAGVRIEAELSSGDGFTIWSQTYSGDLSHILDLQDEIAGSIAGTLTHRLFRPDERLRRPVAVKPEAYRDYLQARYELAQRTDESVRRAIALFRRVTALQPDFAEGFAGLASAESNAVFNFSHRELIGPGTAAVRTTVRLDPGNTEALVASAGLALVQWQWDAAAQALHKMLNLQGSDSNVLNMKGLLLKYLGFPEQSLRAARASAELDTLYGVAWANIASSLFELGRYRGASAAAANALALLPNQPDLMVEQCGAWAHSGSVQQAQAMVAGLSQAQATEHAEGCRFEIALAAGNVTEAKRLAGQLVNAPPQRSPRLRETAGQYYLLAGDVPTALSLFENAYDRKDLGLLTLAGDPSIVSRLRGNSRWEALWRRPLLVQWRAAHSRIAAELGAGR
jgi:TolB-like protein/Tfp pilus assembly protein PilF